MVKYVQELVHMTNVHSTSKVQCLMLAQERVRRRHDNLFQLVSFDLRLIQCLTDWAHYQFEKPPRSFSGNLMNEAMRPEDHCHGGRDKSAFAPSAHGFSAATLPARHATNTLKWSSRPGAASTTTNNHLLWKQVSKLLAVEQHLGPPRSLHAHQSAYPRRAVGPKMKS